jgi:hypothetical protein
MTAIITNPALVINNVPITYIPNSVKYKEGIGDVTVKTQTAGGRSIDNITSYDISTARSMVSFDMASTVVNVEQARKWKIRSTTGEFNAIRLTDSQGFSRSFRQATMTSEPEIPLGNDGVFSVSFEALTAE